ncbi:MAG: hypothetical protein SF028_02750 [Candidatus Sumerlaeia bacterium]|nr:hypothetical protein [Candidatus Sumerlaeia bacterium]
MIPSTKDGGQPLFRLLATVLAPALALAAASLVLLVRAQAVPSRGLPGWWLLAWAAMGGAAAAVAALGARLPAGPRHAYNIHLLVVAPAVLCGFPFASDFAEVAPGVVALAFPMGGALAASLLAASAFPSPRAAAAVALAAYALLTMPLRPLSPPAANTFFALAAAGAAWLAARTLAATDREDPGLESPPHVIGACYVTTNAVLAIVMLPLVWMAMAGLILPQLAEAELIPPEMGALAAQPGADRVFRLGDVAARLLVAGLAAGVAAFLASRDWLGSGDPVRVAAGVCIAACGASLGGQTMNGTGFTVAGFAVVLVGAGLMMAFGGGMRGARAPRVAAAAMLAFLLGGDLLEPSRGERIFTPWAAVAFGLEALVVAGALGAGYWFALRPLRLSLPQPVPRAKAFAPQSPPPPAPPPRA